MSNDCNYRGNIEILLGRRVVVRIGPDSGEDGQLFSSKSLTSIRNNRCLSSAKSSRGVKNKNRRRRPPAVYGIDTDVFADNRCHNTLTSLILCASHRLLTAGRTWWEGGNKPASLITGAVYFTYDVPIGRQTEVRSVSVARPATCKFRRLFPSSVLIYSRFFSSSFPCTSPRDLPIESPPPLWFIIRHLLIRQFVLY
jgi:hypothetical protein